MSRNKKGLPKIRLRTWDVQLADKAFSSSYGTIPCTDRKSPTRDLWFCFISVYFCCTRHRLWFEGGTSQRNDDTIGTKPKRHSTYRKKCVFLWLNCITSFGRISRYHCQNAELKRSLALPSSSSSVPSAWSPCFLSPLLQTWPLCVFQQNSLLFAHLTLPATARSIRHFTLPEKVDSVVSKDVCPRIWCGSSDHCSCLRLLFTSSHALAIAIHGCQHTH